MIYFEKWEKISHNFHLVGPGFQFTKMLFVNPLPPSMCEPHQIL